jgi:hypothetical protein
VGELANVPKDYEVGSVGGHKHIEAVLGGFKHSFALCKRRRFGDYESNPTLGEVVSRQYDLWQASTSSQVVPVPFDTDQTITLTYLTSTGNFCMNRELKRQTLVLHLSRRRT